MKSIYFPVVVISMLVQAGCALVEKEPEPDPPPVEVGYIEERRGSTCSSSSNYPSAVMAPLRGFHQVGKLSVENYDAIGKAWGIYMADVAKVTQNVNNRETDIFSCFLVGYGLPESAYFDYFGIHRDMKKAFQSGFREGYGERNSDLVLGVNLNEAARLKALDAAVRLMDVYREKIVADVVATSRFKRDWGNIMDETLGTFEEITAEGSPAESTAFLSSFPVEYESELNALTSCLEHSGEACDLRPNLKKKKKESEITVNEIYAMLTEGFSREALTQSVLKTKMTYSAMTVHIDDEDRVENTYFKYSSKKKKNLSSPMMLSDAQVVNRILRGDGLVEQINKISWLFVGQEMGRKFNHNLISRRELVEWIKRARSIMESKSGANYYHTSVRLLRDGFQEGYGSGGVTEWGRIREETELDI